MANHPVGTAFQKKHGNTGERICLTECTDVLPKYGETVMYHKRGRMPVS